MDLPPITIRLDHRGGLFSAYPPPCFDRIGDSGISLLVDTLYDGIESDKVLRPAFGRDLAKERANQKRFFTAFFGGPRDYFDGWHPGLRERHVKISISRGMADRWLGHFRRGLETAAPDLVEQVMPFIEQIAYSLVSRSSEPLKGERLRGSCSMAEIRAAENSLARGESLAQFGHLGPRLLVSAAAKGSVEAVRELLAGGVDPNRAFKFSPSDGRALGLPDVPVTSLCAAALRKRQPAVNLLIEKGAQYDIFSAIALGDVAAVKVALKDESSLANAVDPADDLAEITTLYHAVLAGQIEIARLLIDRGASIEPNPIRLVRIAANAGNEMMVDLLLAQGARAAGLGAGHWVVHSRIAEKLLAKGADVNAEPGKWIGICCTGNSGHRENLPLVRAMLDRGADVKALYRGRSALDHAEQAKFGSVVKLLIEAGC